MGYVTQVRDGSNVLWDIQDATAYHMPATGIPKTDLASAVQTSLGLADTALQAVPATYRTAAAQDVIDATKQDKLPTAVAGNYLHSNSSTGELEWISITPSSEFFWCTYGTTTYAAIVAAIADGLQPMMHYNDILYRCVGYDSSYCYFVALVLQYGNFPDLYYAISFASGTGTGWASGTKILLSTSAPATITSVYTFQASPYVPTPTVSTQATSKQYVDNTVATKQDALPTVVAGRYLHANESTGELEWSAGTSATLAWTQIGQAHGTSSISLSVSSFSEIMICATVTQSSSTHFGSVVIPVACLSSSTQDEVSLGGGYGGSSASKYIFGGISAASFAGKHAYINGTDYISYTAWGIFAR